MQLFYSQEKHGVNVVLYWASLSSPRENQHDQILLTVQRLFNCSKIGHRDVTVVPQGRGMLWKFLGSPIFLEGPAQIQCPWVHST